MRFLRSRSMDTNENPVNNRGDQVADLPATPDRPDVEVVITLRNTTTTTVTPPAILSLAAVVRKVFVNKKLTCATAMEIPYYQAKIYPLVCYYCGLSEDLPVVDNDTYPACGSCAKDKNKQNVKKRKRNLVTEKQNKKAAKEARLQSEIGR